MKVPCCGANCTLWATGWRVSLAACAICRQWTRPRPAARRERAGVVNVPLSQIVGSEGRASDFDSDFHPLNDNTRDRWINIAAAIRRGASMPPVELIQAADGYYVRDGHHRISVARAAGQASIEGRIAYVLVN
ncbi:MAG: hypothetical protein IPH95_07545 [Candidatus Promineofilum sp.]|nr:hypothetical protein [Promineifilum sp.]